MPSKKSFNSKGYFSIGACTASSDRCQRDVDCTTKDAKGPKFPRRGNRDSPNPQLPTKRLQNRTGLKIVKLYLIFKYQTISNQTLKPLSFTRASLEAQETLTLVQFPSMWVSSLSILKAETRKFSLEAPPSLRLASRDQKRRTRNPKSFSNTSNPRLRPARTGKPHLRPEARLWARSIRRVSRVWLRVWALGVCLQDLRIGTVGVEVSVTGASIRELRWPGVDRKLPFKILANHNIARRVRSTKSCLVLVQECMARHSAWL